MLSWLKPIWRSSNPSFLLSEGLAMSYNTPNIPSNPSQQTSTQDVWKSNLGAAIAQQAGSNQTNLLLVYLRPAQIQSTQRESGSMS